MHQKILLKLQRIRKVREFKRVHHVQSYVGGFVTSFRVDFGILLDGAERWIFFSTLFFRVA